MEKKRRFRGGEGGVGEFEVIDAVYEGRPVINGGDNKKSRKRGKMPCNRSEAQARSPEYAGDSTGGQRNGMHKRPTWRVRSLRFSQPGLSLMNQRKSRGKKCNCF